MPSRPALRTFHRWFGWLTLVVFLVTGQFMRYVHEPPVEELEPALRLLFRSRHIYLLFAALLLLLAGGLRGSGRPRWLVVVGSVLLTLSPVLLLTAFVVETGALGSPSGLSTLGIQAALGGTLALVVAHRRDRTKD